MKKSQIFILLNFFVLSLFVQGTQGQATVRAEVFAEVISAITATETSQLNFGRFSPTTQGGQIIITPDGSRMSTGTVVLSQGSHRAAGFYVTGEDNATFSISLPEDPATITNVSSAKTMVVDGWVSNPPSGSAKGILLGGAQEIHVGATLNVGSMQDNPVGIYSGTYIIKFDYN